MYVFALFGCVNGTFICVYSIISYNLLSLFCVQVSIISSLLLSLCICFLAGVFSFYSRCSSVFLINSFAYLLSLLIILTKFFLTKGNSHGFKVLL